MLQQINPSSFSRAGIDLLVKEWLKHRQEVLVYYSQLSTLTENHEESLEHFCEVLLDYIAAGHFKMFEKLAEFYQSSTQAGLQVSPNDLPLNSNLLKKILITTDVVLEFNETYTKPKSLEKLSFDLSHLGETLANRMDWEDEFVRYCLKTSC